MTYIRCFMVGLAVITLRWRHNDHAGVSNHQPHGCLLNRLFRRKSKKTSKLRVTGLCAGNSPGTGEFPAQMASYAENVSIWWRHHENSSLTDMHHVWLIAIMTTLLKYINGMVRRRIRDLAMSSSQWFSSHEPQKDVVDLIISLLVLNNTIRTI